MDGFDSDRTVDEVLRRVSRGPTHRPNRRRWTESGLWAFLLVWSPLWGPLALFVRGMGGASAGVAERTLHTLAVRSDLSGSVLHALAPILARWGTELRISTPFRVDCYRALTIIMQELQRIGHPLAVRVGITGYNPGMGFLTMATGVGLLGLIASRIGWWAPDTAVGNAAGWLSESLGAFIQGTALGLGVVAGAGALIGIAISLTACGGWLLGSPQWTSLMTDLVHVSATISGPFIPWVFVAFERLYGVLYLFGPVPMIPLAYVVIWALVWIATVIGTVGGPALLLICVLGWLQAARQTDASSDGVFSGDEPRACGLLVGLLVVDAAEAVVIGAGWPSLALARWLPLFINLGLLLLIGLPFIALMVVCIYHSRADA